MTCRAAPSSGATCAGSTPTGNALSYDNEGRLTGWQSTPTTPLQSASYLYDGEGNRVEQVATAGGGATTTTTSYGGLAESVNGALSYTLADGLGSVSAAVSANTGAVSATQLYGPYGAVRYQQGTSPTDKGYTGQRADAATSRLGDGAQLGLPRGMLCA